MATLNSTEVSDLKVETSLFIGENNNASTGTSEWKLNVVSALKDVIVVPSEKVFEIQHQCQTKQATDGFGVAASFASNIYTRIQIVKLI